jgi:ribosome-associated translation inhibitor RaiA
MHIHMEGKDTGLVPHLIGRIAERLEALNTPDEDIFEARITFVQRRRQEAVRVQLRLVDKRLQVTQCGATPDAAIDAALQRVQQALHEARVEKRARAIHSVEDSYTQVTTVD